MQQRQIDDDDNTLLRRAADGCEESFVALYRRHSRSVFRFALRMTGNETTAEEVVQEVFMTLLRLPRAYDAARGGVQAWLLGIARNHVLRAFERRPEECEDAIEEAGVAPDALRMLIEREDRDSLRAAILTLPAVYREALVLCDLSELDYRDAARVTGCSVGTVRSRLHRARNLLASKLAGRKRKGREPAERFGVGI